MKRAAARMPTDEPGTTSRTCTMTSHNSPGPQSVDDRAQPAHVAIVDRRTGRCLRRRRSREAGADNAAARISWRPVHRVENMPIGSRCIIMGGAGLPSGDAV